MLHNFKTNTMKDLIDFQRFQIESLQKKVCELEYKLQQTKQYCFELTDNECPDEYKTLVKVEIYNLTQN